MLNRHNILVWGLSVVALFASTTQAAETIKVDPGAVGESAQNLSFSVTAPSTDRVDLVFTDSKTLTFGPGEQKFELEALTNQGFQYDGVLLDATGNEIPGTEFTGIANVRPATVALEASTVWSGMRFNGLFFLGAYGLVWIPGSDLPLPEVGDLTGNRSPTADAGGPYTGVVWVPVTFDGAESSAPEGDITQYDWDFGDGTQPLIDGGPTPSHTYSVGYTYNVTLTVTDEDDAVSSQSTTAKIGRVSVPPTADPGGPYPGAAGVPVTFNGEASSDPDNGIVRYLWSFGDGQIGAGSRLTHTYDAVGNYTVILKVEDAGGDSDSEVTEANISTGNQPPTANADGPYFGVINEALIFNGGASSDLEGPIKQYDWDFGDGTNPLIDGGPTPSHTYKLALKYVVKLTVTDQNGGTNSTFTTADIDDNNQPPVADAGGPYTGNAGEAVKFNGTGSTDPDDNIAIYFWIFGDGQFGEGPEPSHTYDLSGILYEVDLIVVDELGEVSVDETYADYDFTQDPPVADANGPYPGLVDAPVTFDGKASSDANGTIETYAWDFGDGTLGSGDSPQHTYTSADTYDVTLTVTDDDGQTDQSSTKAVIAFGNGPPLAEAGGPYSGVVGVAVPFDGSASIDPGGEIVSYKWDFGDDGSDVAEKPEHVYSLPSIYNVTLTVTDSSGFSTSDTTTANIGSVSAPPMADADGPYPGKVDAAVSFDGSGSSDPDGTIAQYDWDFGDGTAPLVNGGATPTHTYSATESSAKYIVTLTVTDDSGESGTDSTKAIIAEGNLPPVPNAGGPYTGDKGVIVSFDGSGSKDLDGQINSYAWTFGDGGTDVRESPSYVYDEEGTFAVTLTVTDDAGAPNSDSTTVVIGPVIVGGTVQGVEDSGGNRVACQKEGERVKAALTGNAWDCEAMGLELDAGGSLYTVLNVTANGDSVAGTASGIDPTRLYCANLTSGQISRQLLSNDLDWNCSAAGLIANPGDQLRIRIGGVVVK